MTILNNKNNILVVLEIEKLLDNGCELRLVKKAKELANNKCEIISMVIGNDIDKKVVEDISRYCDRVVVYDLKKLELFNEEIYSAIIKEFINKNKPEFLLMNNDDFGKILCSRIAGYFNTSVLTNCSDLTINSNNNLVEFKEICHSRIEIENKAPNIKIATVNVKKIKINDIKEGDKGTILFDNIEGDILKEAIQILEHCKVKDEISIDKAEILVVAGKGVKNKEDLGIIKKLATALGAEVGFTRPLVQFGWAEHINQVGISGTTVKPKVIVTIGVSGASQFTDAMDKSGYIISINTDSNAPIFKIANCGIVGDLYEIIPRLLDRIN